MNDSRIPAQNHITISCRGARENLIGDMEAQYFEQLLKAIRQSLRIWKEQIPPHIFKESRMQLKRSDTKHHVWMEWTYRVIETRNKEMATKLHDLLNTGLAKLCRK